MGLRKPLRLGLLWDQGRGGDGACGDTGAG